MSQICATCSLLIPGKAAFCPGCGASSGRSAALADSSDLPSSHQLADAQPGPAGSTDNRREQSVVRLLSLGAMFLPFKRYLDFDGRSTHLEYWMFTLLCWAVIIGCTGLMIAGVLPSDDPNAEPKPVMVTGMLLLMFWCMGTIVSCIALTICRLHDQDKSGAIAILFYLLSFFLSFLGWIVQTICMCLPGIQRANQYGADPTADFAGDIFA